MGPGRSTGEAGNISTGGRFPGQREGMAGRTVQPFLQYAKGTSKQHDARRRHDLPLGRSAFFRRPNLIQKCFHFSLLCWFLPPWTRRLYHSAMNKSIALPPAGGVARWGKAPVRLPRAGCGANPQGPGNRRGRAPVFFAPPFRGAPLPFRPFWGKGEALFPLTFEGRCGITILE